MAALSFVTSMGAGCARQETPPVALVPFSTFNLVRLPKAR